MKHLISILLLSTTFAILLGNSNLFASTDVSGNINEDTIWTLPVGVSYIATGTLDIMSGATLTIETGVTVDLGTSIDVGADGTATLIADGVTFNSNNGSDIRFYPQGSGSITNCVLNGVTILINGSDPIITYCLILLCHI